MILVTGADGQLGKSIKKISSSYDDSFIFAGKDEFDITNLSSLKEFYRKKPFKYLINCAAYTNVEQAEDDSTNAFLVNYQGAKNLALLADEFSIKLAHVSTDYVFDGNKSTPYQEDDPTSPLSIYGKSKLQGEEEILKICDNAIIIRTSWLYSEFPDNFFSTIVKLAQERESLKIVSDQISSPTYATTLAKILIEVIHHNLSGIYHFSNEGVSSWYDFTCEIVKNAKIDCVIQPIKSSEYSQKAIRPSYSLLSKEKIKKDLDITIPHWRDGLGAI